MPSLKFKNPITGKFERLSDSLIKGKDGITPHIGDNDNWWIGDTDTGIKAKGKDGLTPHIGDNDNWWIGDTDTGVRADAGSYTETDPTVPAWAKEPSKPTYTANEVGADASGSAASALASAKAYADGIKPTKTSQLTNDSGFITNSVESGLNVNGSLEVSTSATFHDDVTVEGALWTTGEEHSYIHSGSILGYAAPPIAFGTADVTAGSASTYPEGTLYVVIE